LDFETLDDSDWEEVARIWDLLEAGDVEHARRELKARFRARIEHPDLRIVDAAIALEEDDPESALTALEGAERSADPALFFHLRASALFDLSRFEPAKLDVERALTVRPELAESHDLLSRTLEHLGQAADADEHAQTANALDPERFPMPLEVADAEFDQLVERSLKELPPPIRKQLEELPVLVEPLPGAELLTHERPPLSPDLLGLYVGRDLMSRSTLDLPDAPGAIFLFRRNLLRFCASLEELEKEIRITVQHEVGHLLGLDEDDLERWGLA